MTASGAGVILQACDAASNTVFQTVVGVLKIKVTRNGGCRPATMTALVASDPLQDGPTSGLKRFYPFMGIRVVESDDATVSSNDRLYFSGRVDSAFLKEDDQYGRIWEIKARCWLSVLQDNYIDVGRWWSADLSSVRGTIFNRYEPYTANYVGYYQNRSSVNLQGPLNVQDMTPGEYRKNIIFDLAMNVVQSYNLSGQDTLVGVAGFTYSFAPNSKKIQFNAENSARLNILDTIRELARSDPWWPNYPFSNGEVDAYDLLFPPPPYMNGTGVAGIGGELQAMAQTVADGGRTLEYYARGRQNANMNYSYGNPNRVTGVDAIVSYDFGRTGEDVFSRSRTEGKGLSRSGTPVSTGGTGEAIPEMETTWDPARGLFRVRREWASRLQSYSGEWNRQNDVDELKRVAGRALRDAAIAGFVSGAEALSNTRGGPSRGTITVIGRPNDPVGGVIRPGELTHVEIPHLGLYGLSDKSTEFTIDSWSYEWPTEMTTIQLSRSGISDLGTQLASMLLSSNDTINALQDGYDTGWQRLSPSQVASASISVNHLLGVIPRNIMLYVGVWDESTFDQGGEPVPYVDQVRTMGQEASGQAQTAYTDTNGQQIGYLITTATDKTVTLSLGYYLAYLAQTAGLGNSGWIIRDSSSTIYRLIVEP